MWKGKLLGLYVGLVLQGRGASNYCIETLPVRKSRAQAAKVAYLRPAQRLCPREIILSPVDVMRQLKRAMMMPGMRPRFPRRAAALPPLRDELAKSAPGQELENQKRFPAHAPKAAADQPHDVWMPQARQVLSLQRQLALYLLLGLPIGDEQAKRLDTG